MSFTELLEELETLTSEQRRQIIDRVMEIDEPELAEMEKKLIQNRMAEHDENPDSAIPLGEVMERLRSGLKR